MFLSKERQAYRLSVFENKVMKRMFGPPKKGGNRRMVKIT